ncbi:hypothetical protein [Flavobacterium alvei]|jgi:hypothetical protein|uniref:hypothetical protein n=1 Tax=Flavobacterium alvei TaxID=2080416 RepID=UPI0026E989AD|nr:hypothetical protein [Flavobacterium alvei]
MNSKNVFSTTYRQDYFKGYSIGQNPLLQIDPNNNSFGYISGFNSGRMDYEEMNGQIAKGIPKRIVTIKILEEFLLAGLLGLGIEETDDFTSYQLNVIGKWYQSGVEKYDPEQSNYLFEILENRGIQID